MFNEETPFRKCNIWCVQFNNHTYNQTFWKVSAKLFHFLIRIELGTCFVYQIKLETVGYFGSGIIISTDIKTTRWLWFSAKIVNIFFLKC